MATPYNGFDLPVVGADADTWGSEINAIINAIDTLLSSPANTIKGNNTGAQIASLNLTGAQVTAMLSPAAGATQSVGGAKGLVPAATAGQQDRVLAGDGTFRTGIGRSFGCIITSTDVNGSQPTLSGALNVASISTVTVSGTDAIATITFTNALPSAAYAVAMVSNKAAQTSYGAKTTTTLVVTWGVGGGGTSEVSVSGF